jgi:hypothetical protein
LNRYHDHCLDIIQSLNLLQISHIPREDNWRANVLAQQAFGYKVRRGLFMVKEKLTVTLVDTTDDESVEAMERVGTVTKAKPTELPSAGDMSAVEESGIAKPIEQPSAGNVSATRMSITTKPAVQHGTGEGGHVSYGNKQSE